jgi:hypothetical protein
MVPLMPSGTKQLVITYGANGDEIKRVLKDIDDSHSKTTSKFAALSGAFGMMKGNLGELAAGFGPLTDAAEKAGKGIDHIKEKVAELEGRGQKAGAVLVGVGAGLTGIGALGVAMGEKQEQATKTLEVAIKNTGGSYEEYAKSINKAVAAGEKNAHGAADTKEAFAKLTTALGDAGKASNEMGLVDEVAAKKHISLADAADQVLKIHQGASKVLKQYGIDVKAQTAITTDVTKETKAAEVADTASAKAATHLADVHALLAGKKKLTIAETLNLRNATQADEDAARKSDDAHAKLAAAMEKAKTGASGLSYEQQVLAKIHGTAAAQADTFGGRIAAMKTHVMDAAGAIGAKFGPALTMAGPLIMGLGAILETGLIPKIVLLGGEIIGTAAMWVGSWLSMMAGTVSAMIGVNISTGGLLLILGALIAAVLLVWKNWDTIWGFIKNITTEAFDWIRNHLVYIALAFGPLGLIIYEFAHHWQGVWEGIQAVIAWVWGAISPVIHFIGEAIRLYIVTEVNILKAVWDVVWTGVTAVAGAAWEVLRPIISGIGATLGWLVDHGIALVKAEILLLFAVWTVVWNGIQAVIQAVWKVIEPIIHAITTGVKDVEGALKAIGNVGGAVGHFLGFQVGGTVPGPVGAPMLAVVHGGEEITPVGGSRGGGGGNTYILQQVIHGTVVAQRELTNATYEGFLELKRRQGSLDL